MCGLSKKCVPEAAKWFSADQVGGSSASFRQTHRIWAPFVRRRSTDMFAAPQQPKRTEAANAKDGLPPRGIGHSRQSLLHNSLSLPT